MTVKTAKNHQRVPLACSRVLHCVFPVMVVGLALLAAGLVLKLNWAVKAGTVAFLGGLPLCGFANVVALTWAMAGTIREAGVHNFISDLREEPRPWVILMLILVLYSVLAIGGLVLVLAAMGAFK